MATITIEALEASRWALAEAKCNMQAAIEAYEKAAFANVEAQAELAAAQGFTKSRFITCKMDDMRNHRAQWSGGPASPHNVAETIMREAIATTCIDPLVMCKFAE